MRFKSLAFRLFVTALGWTMVVLPIAGFLVYSMYAREVFQSFDDRIKTLLWVVQADVADHTGTELGTPGDVGEPLFQRQQSGWYWQIKPLDEPGGPRRASSSLANAELPSPFQQWVAPDSQDIRWSDAKGPFGQRLRLGETIERLGDEVTGRRYSIIVAGPIEWPEARVSEFRAKLATALALAGLGLVLMTLFQVRFGLMPLRAIERDLARVRAGEAKQLDGRLPVEIEPLQKEINALIQSNQDIVDRARTQVGNLAHALKTPLAVITNEADDDRGAFATKVSEQARVMRDQIGLYLDRARMAAQVDTIGKVTELAPVIEPLQRALERIYRDKGVAISVTCPETAKFQGEKQDIEEMLGNLLDNACKWSKGRVFLIVTAPEAAARAARRRLEIKVEDDGPGLTTEQRNRIGKRGLRLDESKPGTGLGLSIVGDLVQSYRGAMSLNTSQYGGLAVTLDLPAV
jgi:signal transduction histidine kinase